MGCECVLDYSDYDIDEQPKFWSVKERTARKEHACCECGGPILPGQVYEVAGGRWGDEWLVFKACGPCLEIRANLCCGHLYECLYRDLRESLRESRVEDIDLCCIDGLTVEALDRLERLVLDRLDPIEAAA